MANRPQTAAQPTRRRPLGKKQDAATRLNCSVDSIDRYIRAGKIPVVRLPSGQKRIDLEELDRLIGDWKAASR